MRALPGRLMVGDDNGNGFMLRPVRSPEPRAGQSPKPYCYAWRGGADG